jgi:hypothetical protein
VGDFSGKNIFQMIGQYFSEKMRPTPKKFLPKGEIVPNQVTLLLAHVIQPHAYVLRCFLTGQTLP